MRISGALGSAETATRGLVFTMAVTCAISIEDFVRETLGSNFIKHCIQDSMSHSYHVSRILQHGMSGEH